jgi:hypothetical protein
MKFSKLLSQEGIWYPRINAADERRERDDKEIQLYKG